MGIHALFIAAAAVFVTTLWRKRRQERNEIQVLKLVAQRNRQRFDEVVHRSQGMRGAAISTALHDLRKKGDIERTVLPKLRKDLKTNEKGSRPDVQYTITAQGQERIQKAE